MFKRIISMFITTIFAFFASSAIAQQPAQSSQIEQWDKYAKGVKKPQRGPTKTADGKPVLVDETGKMYLLTEDGKRFVVDQNGNRIQVDEQGKMILTGEQKEIPLRFGPGPLA